MKHSAKRRREMLQRAEYMIKILSQSYIRDGFHDEIKREDEKLERFMRSFGRIAAGGNDLYDLEFICKFCDAYGQSSGWLMTGDAKQMIEDAAARAKGPRALAEACETIASAKIAAAKIVAAA